jgi:hypothetical protein
LAPGKDLDGSCDQLNRDDTIRRTDRLFGKGVSIGRFELFEAMKRRSSPVLGLKDVTLRDCILSP